MSVINVSEHLESLPKSSKIDVGYTHDEGLLTVRQFCSKYQWPTESGMRSYIFRAGEMGISDAFVRVKRRVLIAPSKFFLLIRQLESRSTTGGAYETTAWCKGKAHP